MSLLFPYHQVSVQHPAIALGGRMVRPRALVGVTMLFQNAGRYSLGLLDSGADDTVFSDLVASMLGIDLSNAPVGTATGIASSPVPLRYAQVALRITDGREWCEWQGWVGFTTAPLRQPLLGFAGCLQFFHADFRGDREEVELTSNTLFTGRTGTFPN